MKIEQMFLTPEKASAFLLKNNNNRPIRKQWIEELARRIKTGEWKLIHQGIAFDKRGNLIDGQHRLHAIVKAGVAVPIMVYSDLMADSPIDFPADDGLRRSHSDSLKTNRATAEVASFIGYLVYGIAPSTARVQHVLDAFGDSINSLLSFCPSARRGRTTAPIRSAVCIRSTMQDEYQTFSDYRNFVLLDFDSLPPSLVSLVRHTDSVSSAFKYDSFARAFIAFDNKRRNVSKIIIRDQASIINEVREYVKKIMLEHGHEV